MKNLFKHALCLLVVAAVGVSTLSAATPDKADYKDLKAKIDKDSSKAAKSLEKEGWKIMPGALPLERQIMNSKLATLATEEDSDVLTNFTASSRAKGGNFNAAKKVAQHQARTELIDNISSNIKNLIRENTSNTDLGDNDFDTISEFVSTNESVASSILQGVTVVYEVYREQSKFTEVDVNLYISRKAALESIRDEMRKSLSDETKKLAEKL